MFHYKPSIFRYPYSWNHPLLTMSDIPCGHWIASFKGNGLIENNVAMAVFQEEACPPITHIATLGFSNFSLSIHCWTRQKKDPENRIQNRAGSEPLQQWLPKRTEGNFYDIATMKRYLKFRGIWKNLNLPSFFNFYVIGGCELYIYVSIYIHIYI